MKLQASKIIPLLLRREREGVARTLIGGWCSGAGSVSALMYVLVYSTCMHVEVDSVHVVRIDNTPSYSATAQNI